MQLLWTILVTFFAGMGAGLGTGFAGMSAAAAISPMLITFLHMDPIWRLESHYHRMYWQVPFPRIPIIKIKIWMSETDLL